MKDIKENTLILTDTFTKFSQTFVTPNQKAINIAKIFMDKWFYVSGISTCIHSNEGQSFDNENMTYLSAVFGIEQSTTMPYNLHGNVTCERLNCLLTDVLKLLPKEWKSSLPLHLLLLVFAYNIMLHSTTSYRPYELMFGCKAPIICDTWLGLTDYNDIFSESKCAWVNQQHEIILAVNRCALKRIEHSVKRSVSQHEEKLFT